MKTKTILFALLTLVPMSMSAQQSISISERPTAESMTLVNDMFKTTIAVADNDAEVVKTVANCLADDIELVCGKRPDVTNSLAQATLPIIAGTIGQSAFIDQLVSEGKIDVSDICGKWEVFTIQKTKNPQALVVAGSTPRGTAYGLFELSRQMGVSPYVWWADVAPAKKEALYANGEKTISKEPSVKYRGIFINDEDFALFPWAAKGIDKKYNNIGPNTYARVMELLLRLRANTLWPAMHLCSEAFWANKDNLPVAKKYDIMLGSSHCEQMLRDNEWEWRHAPWNGNNEDWNYVTNKAKIQQYWEERVAES
nr:glycosyl hydrolase 115 family protein [Prevotella sp.]